MFETRGLRKTRQLFVAYAQGQSDCQVHLQPQLIPPNMEEYMGSLLAAVLPSTHNKFRIYVSMLRLMDYSISDEVTKAVEDDFVEMRKYDPQSITAEDLHRMLVVARLLSLSAGQTTQSTGAVAEGKAAGAAAEGKDRAAEVRQRE